MKKLIYILKGIVIGIATLIPGVSGGTMSIILGVYDEMIHAVSSYFQNIKKNTIFLGLLSIGGIVGIGAFSKIVEYSLNHFRIPMIYLFLGIIVGGLPVLFKKANVDSKRKKDWIYFMIGLLIIIIMTFYNGSIVNLAASTGLVNFLFLIIAGIIIAIALILPGISTSFMLLVLGLYDITLKAINTLDTSILIPIGIGVVIGVITTTKILENFLEKKPRQTYMLILGFVIGSIIEVFPGVPQSYEILYSLITFVIGFIVIKYISEKDN